MAEPNLQHEDGDLQPPAKLVAALRQLPQPVILVPQQVDEAALMGPRLHLARIRQLSDGESASVEKEDLALAAHTKEQAVRPSDYTLRGVLGPMEHFKPKKPQGSRAVWYLAVIALLAIALLLWRWRAHNSQHGGISPPITRHTTP